MAKANLRRINCLVYAQTLYNLNKLAKICGYGDNIGKIIDKLTRAEMMSMKEIANQDYAAVITLSHCPYCDGNPYFLKYKGSNWRVECNCDAAPQTAVYKTLEEAISAWNGGRIID